MKTLIAGIQATLRTNVLFLMLVFLNEYDYNAHFCKSDINYLLCVLTDIFLLDFTIVVWYN